MHLDTEHPSTSTTTLLCATHPVATPRGRASVAPTRPIFPLARHQQLPTQLYHDSLPLEGTVVLVTVWTDGSPLAVAARAGAGIIRPVIHQTYVGDGGSCIGVRSAWGAQ